MNTKQLIAISVLLATLPARGVDRAELDQRIRVLTAKFESMQADTTKRIPADLLREAKAVVLFDRTKAGLLFAYQGGMGVALVRDAKSGKWSAPAFMKAEEASLGVQVGVQQSFVVAVCLSTNAAQKLTESQMTLGGEARGTAGKDSAGTATADDDADRSVRVFFDRDGLYGGAALNGGTIAPDPKLNALYYERGLSPREILFENKVKPSEAAAELAGKIQAQTRHADKAQN